ncbi:MAG: sigma-70 family RNA polymerase sigma factor [Methylococcales bacterium]|nr:sigma-70 family RNA polymerase sigma factor [Methylococcales bacterium]
MDIKIILIRIKNGDQSAFSLVVEHFQRPLFGYLGRMGLTQSVAEEVAQETFLRAWNQLNRYDPARAQFSTWLFTIARNLALHELERSANKLENNDDEIILDYACQRYQPFEKLTQEQQSQALMTMLQTLPLTDRSALALAYFQEFDMASIARIEGCTVSAIKVRIHRAKQKLRLLLEEHDE